jgi:hypothetical protein
MGKQKTLAHLLTRLARLEPNVHQTGDVYLDTYRFYDALFGVIAHPDANNKTLRDNQFVTAFSHMLAQASQIAVENYKSDYRNVNVLNSAVLNNTAVVILRIQQQSPELLEYLLSACKVPKTVSKRILKAINTHEQCLESTLSSMLTDFANGRNVRLYFKQPKSRSAYANDQSRRYFDLLADFIAGYEGMPLLTLKTLGLANAYIENILASDLAKDAKAAALIKQSIKSPIAMAKAAHWVLERSQSRASDLTLKMVYDRKPGLLPVATMLKRSKPIDHLRQDLGRYGDSCHIDYAMLNTTNWHLEVGFATTESNFSMHAMQLATCINGMSNSLQTKRPGFRKIKTHRMVFRYVVPKQTSNLVQATQTMHDANLNSQTDSEYHSVSELLENWAPEQYEAIRESIKIQPIGNSSVPNYVKNIMTNTRL